MGDFNLNELLHAERAKLVGEEAEPLTTDRTVRRGWDKLPIDSEHEIRAHFFSTLTYTDPVIQGRTFTGTWRSAAGTFKANGGGLQVIEELRLGYLTTLGGSGSISFAEARIVQGTQVDSDEGIRVLEWRNIAPSKLNDVAAELSEATYTTVAAHGDAIAGTWNNVRVESDREKDGSGVVRLVLSLNERIETVTSRAGTFGPETVVRYFNVPDNRISTVIALATTPATRENKTATISYNNGFADIVIGTTAITTSNATDAIAATALSTNTVVRYWAQTAAEIDALKTSLAAETASPGVSRTFVRQRNENGTYDLISTTDAKTLTEAIVNGTIATMDGKARDVRHLGKDAEEFRYLWVNISSDDIATVRTSLATAPTGYTVISIDEAYGDTDDLTNVTWTIRNDGGTAWYTTENQYKSEAESIVVTLIQRPSVPMDPDIVGYDLIRREIRGEGQAQSDYLYVYSKKGTIQHVSQKAEYTGEAEVHTVSLLNRKDDPGIPTETGYVATRLQINNPDAVQSDYIWTLEQEGTSEFQTRISQPATEAATIQVELLKRSSVPTPDPSISGYVIVNTDVRQPANTLPDYIYLFRKLGTTPHTTRKQEVGAEAEVRTVELLNRNAVPTPTPTVTGYTNTGQQINRIDEVLSDYIYSFTKIGVTDLTVRTVEPASEVIVSDVVLLNRAALPSPEPTLAGYKVIQTSVDQIGNTLAHYTYRFQRIGTTSFDVNTRFPGFAGEVVTETYFSRAVDPAVTVRAGYTLADIKRRNLQGVLTDYEYTWRLNSTASGIAITLIGSTTPYFMKRNLYVEQGVPDSLLGARIAYLEDSNNWGPTEIVETVRPQWSGSGQTDLYVTVVTLPDSWTDDQYTVDKFDGVWKPQTFALVTASFLRPTAHNTDATSTDYGKATTYAATTGVQAVPKTGIVGRALREIRTLAAISFHKTEPSIQGLQTGDTFASYSYDSKRKDQRLGFWVKTSITVTAGAWVNTAP